MKPIEQLPLPTTVAEARLRAAEVIRQRGWHQNGFVDSHGAVCAVGALNVVFGIEQREFAFNAFEAPPLHTATLDELEDKLGYAVPDWNDSPERTKEEVIAFLEDI